LSGNKVLIIFEKAETIIYAWTQRVFNPLYDLSMEYPVVTGIIQPGACSHGWHQ
jgi:hypothetical protein